MYEACQGIQYLDMVLCESLRVYPPVARYVVDTSCNSVTVVCDNNSS